MYGNFTTMLVEDAGVRGLDLHLARLARDSGVLFGTAVPDARVRESIARALVGVPRPVVARVDVTAEDFALAHPGGDRLRVAVALRPAPAPVAPLRLQVVAHERSLAAVKHVAIGAELYERRAAQLAGFDDACFRDREGRLTEGPTWSLGVVREGVLVRPHGERLPGVTLALLGRAAAAIGVRVVDEAVTVAGLAGAAAFVANAVTPLRPVAAVDGVGLADTPLLARLAEAYAALPATPLP